MPVKGQNQHQKRPDSDRSFRDSDGLTNYQDKSPGKGIKRKPEGEKEEKGKEKTV